MYIGRKCFNLLSIPTFRATCFDRLSVCVVQLKCSSINIPRNLVNLSSFILFPSTCIKALLKLYFFSFGVNIITFDFLVFRESLLVWNHVEMFLYFYVYLFDESVEARMSMKETCVICKQYKI